MAEKQDEKMLPVEEPVEERPNRAAYAKMFAEDNPDVDFEDKEARYGRMAEERENYRALSKSGKGLSEALDKNRWLGAMFQDLAQNPEKDPISWMYDNGIDVQKAMEDEEYRNVGKRHGTHHTGKLVGGILVLLVNNLIDGVNVDDRGLGYTNEAS